MFTACMIFLFMCGIVKRRVGHPWGNPKKGFWELTKGHLIPPPNSIDCLPLRISIAFRHVARVNLVVAAFVGHSSWISRRTVSYAGSHLQVSWCPPNGSHLFAPFIPFAGKSSIPRALSPRWAKRLQSSRDQHLLWLGQLGLGQDGGCALEGRKNAGNPGGGRGQHRCTLRRILWPTPFSRQEGQHRI